MVVVAVVFSACRHEPRVIVANTPEGNACKRDCMHIYETCMAGRHASKRKCRTRENECLVTCPGFEGQTAAALPPAPADAAETAPAGEGCNPEQLPEWQGASAAQKKALLERCNGAQ